jgi:hypothetical protein
MTIRAASILLVAAAARFGCDGTPDANPDAAQIADGSVDSSLLNWSCDPACNDGIDCTRDVCHPVIGTSPLAGECVYEPLNSLCDDGSECTFNTCNPGSGCETADAPDDTPCSTDGGSVCRQGKCVVPCTDATDCPDDLCTATAPTCDPLLGCQWGSTVVRCEGEDDGVACTEYGCDPATGECAHLPRDSLCDDGNECTADVCHPEHGCLTSILDCPTPCNGGAGVCNGGFCLLGCATDDHCDDSIACTVDTCDACNSGACLFEPDHAQCDDGDPCTTGMCDLAAGCLFEPIPDCLP